MTNLDVLLLKGPPGGDVNAGLDDLRYNILVDGIPSNSDGMSELRIYIWSILLNAHPVLTNTYLDLVRQGASSSYNKIRNDTHRTLKTDPLFKRRVTENSLTRVLNAIAWRLNEAHEAKVKGWASPPTLSIAGDAAVGSPERSFHSAFADAASETGTAQTEAEQVGYVQGMNVLAAPFMYAARSEVEAFTLFERLLTDECPGYVRGGSMDGVHKGLALVDEILAVVDPRLSQYLLSKGLTASIYAFASVLTLSACTPPLPEVLQLWDFLLAYGVHLNLLCIVAQLVLIRDEILGTNSPNQLLRSFPPLQAFKIKSMAVSFIPKIPDELYTRIVMHAK